MSSFEVVGYMELSGSKRSLKIKLKEPSAVFYISLNDVERCKKEPRFAAQIVKVKE